MLKWTLSGRSSSAAPGDASGSRYQIKRASVRVLRTGDGGDKENSGERRFGRWMHRRASEVAAGASRKEASQKRVKVRCNPFDPRRIFAGRDEPESDTGSVYMKLEKMPVAVDDRKYCVAPAGLRDVTNICDVGKSKEVVGLVGRNSAMRGSSRGRPPDVIIKEFTNKPSGVDLPRPVAVKGDSPEAPKISEDETRTHKSQSSSSSRSSISEAQSEPLYGRIGGLEQRKPVKKACVSRGSPGHAHTTTGQHIHHVYVNTPVAAPGALQLRLPAAPKPPETSGHSRAIPCHPQVPSGAPPSSRRPVVPPLPAIPEAVERRRRASNVGDSTPIAGDAATKTGFPASLTQRRSAPAVSVRNPTTSAKDSRNTSVPTYTDVVRYRLTPHMAKLALKKQSTQFGPGQNNSVKQHANSTMSQQTIPALSMTIKEGSQHNTSSERGGDSGISEGLVSPLSESQESYSWEEAGDQRRPPCFYFSQPTHQRTNPVLLESPASPRSAGRDRRFSRRPRSQVSAADVITALKQHREAALAAAEPSPASLRRSRSFSDVSTLSREGTLSRDCETQREEVPVDGWGGVFAETSGNTVVEQDITSAGANMTSRRQKSVRFAVAEPVYKELNGSYVGNDSDALRRSQLYRSYQNIGAVFVGMEPGVVTSSAVVRHSLASSFSRSPPPHARWDLSSPGGEEETYLVMGSPILPAVRDTLPNKATSGADGITSARSPAPVGGLSGNSCSVTAGGRCGRPAWRRQESADRLSLLLDRRPTAMESDAESADWSLEAVINDTLPLLDDDPSAEEVWCGGHSPDSGAEDGENVYASLVLPDEPPVDQPAASLHSDASTLESWNSHVRAGVKPPVAAPRVLPPSEPVYARLDPAKLSPQVDKVTWHGPGRGTVRAVKSRHRSASPSGGRIWRHPRSAPSLHSTPRKRTSHHLRDDSNDFQLGSPAAAGCEPEALGPSETYSNALAFGGTAESSLTTSVWMSLLGRKSRRVVSTQLKTRDTLNGRGQLKLRIYENSGLLTVHVMRARKLRSRAAELCNAYVKVSLVPDASERSFCRTRLVRGTNAPAFDERFSFDFLAEDRGKRLLVSVWHRHVRRGRSELMGCMSFGVSNILTVEIAGWFRLLSESIGRGRHFAVRPASARRKTSKAGAEHDVPWEERTWEEPKTVRSQVTYRRQSPASRPEEAPGSVATPDASVQTAQPPRPVPAQCRQTIQLPCPVRRSAPTLPAERAPWDPPAHTSQVQKDRVSAPKQDCRDRPEVLERVCWGQRAAAWGQLGQRSCRSIATAQPSRHPPQWTQRERTPGSEGPYHRFVIQRRHKGFGLSLAWTCPPSVVFVEPGQSAAAAGLRSGDYVVRMGAENVVLMDQAAGLQLIQRQGDVLEMEIYRPADGAPPSMLDVLRWT